MDPMFGCRLLHGMSIVIASVFMAAMPRMGMVMVMIMVGMTMMGIEQSSVFDVDRFDDNLSA